MLTRSQKKLPITKTSFETEEEVFQRIILSAQGKETMSGTQTGTDTDTGTSTSILSENTSIDDQITLLNMMMKSMQMMHNSSLDRSKNSTISNSFNLEKFSTESFHH
uniref:Uncharacterized protein n=1 Tax=Strongyloides papillosus TaxID=174720 RepID=A0A0N5B2R2_STREA